MLVENHLWYRLNICEANDIERRSREMTTAGVAKRTGDAALAASPRRKLRIGTQVKIDSKKINDHQ